MMIYLSDGEVIHRQYAVLPSRALVDRELTHEEFRTLAALCAFTNSVGVCWPGTQLLGRILGKTHPTVIRTIQRLQRRGYVRKLEPKDFQRETAKFGKAARYQVLFEPDAPLPTWEEVQVAAMLVPESERPANINDNGIERVENHPLALSLAHAYARGVQEATGQTVVIANVIRSAHQHAADGVTPEAMRKASYAACKAALEARRGVPGIGEVSCS